MKIERENTNSGRLSSIVQGEVFEYKGEFYIKTNDADCNLKLCVRLSDGYASWLPEESFVHECEAKVVVE